MWNRKPFFFAVNFVSCHFCLSALSFLVLSDPVVFYGPTTRRHNKIFSAQGGEFLIRIDRNLLQNSCQENIAKDSNWISPFYRLKSVSKLVTDAIRRCHLELVPPLPIWIFRYFPEKAQSSGRRPLHDRFWGIQFHEEHPAVWRASMCWEGVKYKGGS